MKKMKTLKKTIFVILLFIQEEEIAMKAIRSPLQRRKNVLCPLFYVQHGEQGEAYHMLHTKQARMQRKRPVVDNDPPGVSAEIAGGRGCQNLHGVCVCEGEGRLTVPFSRSYQHSLDTKWTKTPMCAARKTGPRSSAAIFP